MKIFITGSSGLIGRWVASQLLADGHIIIGLDALAPRGSFGKVDKFLQCDILDRQSLINNVRESAPDVLIHLAARVDLEEKKNLTGYAANIEGVKNIIDAVRVTPSIGRAIYTSSQLVCRVGYVPQSDTDYCPSTLYGESKVRTEQIVRDENGGGCTWCLVRPTTVWGPHMSVHYQTLLRLIRSRLFFHCGNSPLHKSYAYAGNIAYQYRQLISAPTGVLQGETFYLSDYEPISLRKYADELALAMDAKNIPTLPVSFARVLAKAGDMLNLFGFKRFPFNSFRLKNILTEYIFDVSKTQAVCGPLPFTQEQGIKETARWYLASTTTPSEAADAPAPT